MTGDDREPVFDDDALYEQICGFAAELPSLLAEHQVVADLVPRVDRLIGAADKPFSVAVIGQMRSGKSSLLNALVGADLALTGVNETTATINIFKHGDQIQSDRFRAVWRDRPSEEFPRSDLIRWQGDSEAARATRWLEFYAEAPFLRTADLIDTPGTRSVIEDHTRTIHEFLALRADRETREQGDAADAILYVLPPVARQSDSELLADFERSTRMPGASPYNSLAAVHKWDGLESNDPVAAAMEKADRIRKSLGHQVALVLPVSAPLAVAAETFHDEFWEGILNLSLNGPKDVLEDITLSDSDFESYEPKGCPWSAARRSELRRRFPMPWPSLKLLILRAARCQFGCSMDFRTDVLKASGIIQLRDALTSRFFKRSRLIKAFSVLSKAWEPCQIASSRLRNYKRSRQDLLNDAVDAVDELNVGGVNLAKVRLYLKESRISVEDDLQRATSLLRRLDERTESLRDLHAGLDADLKLLGYIDSTENRIDEKWAERLRCLFGGRGLSLKHRANWLCIGTATEPSFAAANEAIVELRRRLHNSGSAEYEAYEHAVFRIEQIVHHADGTDFIDIDSIE